MRLALAAVSLALVFGWCVGSADDGVRALRLACPHTSDTVEIEPFIAWANGQSPYRRFGAEEADAIGVLQDGANGFYSVDDRNQNILHADCRSKGRILRVFITNQRELTVTEDGRAVIDAVAVGDTWSNWAAIYLWRSSRAGEWQACYGHKTEGYEGLRCEPFDPEHPRTQFLSEPAGCDEFGQHLQRPAGLADYALDGQDENEATWHIDIDRDGVADTLSRFSSGSGSIVPADLSSVDVSLSATGKSFSIQESRLYVIEYARRIYVVGGTPASETGPFPTNIYLLKGDGPQKVCSYEPGR